MNGGELMVLLIVAMGVIGAVLKARYRGTASPDPQAGIDQAENQRLREELRGMKDRLAVLERLATENDTSGARLDREIEKLRDRT